MKLNTLTTAAVLALLSAAPALAQTSGSMSSGDMSAKNMSLGSMSSGSSMHMSSKDKKMITRCQNMSHDMMMKDSGCMRMMKMHPDMMQGR